MSKWFTNKDFEIFKVDGLEERMKEIQERIQPTFKKFGNKYTDLISNKTEIEHPFHIAKHISRKTNPPETTWCAIGGNNRGYKKYPHIQMAINEEHVFIGIAMIDNPTFEKELAKELINKPELWNYLPEDFVISKDHTKTKTLPIHDEVMVKALERMINVKKGEIMIGRTIQKEDRLIDASAKQEVFIDETIEYLLPLYKQLLNVHYKYEQKN